MEQYRIMSEREQRARKGEILTTANALNLAMWDGEQFVKFSQELLADEPATRGGNAPTHRGDTVMHNTDMIQVQGKLFKSWNLPEKVSEDKVN